MTIFKIVDILTNISGDITNNIGYKVSKVGNLARTNLRLKK